LPGGGHGICPDTSSSASPRPAVDTVKSAEEIMNMLEAFDFDRVVA